MKEGISLTASSENVEEHQEDIQNVQEDLHGCENVVFWRQLVLATAHQHLKSRKTIEKS